MNLIEITEPLLNWFDANARVLPWRDSPTPYRVWVSEIMLQQTRVEAVKPYFTRFMEELPTIKALAECEEDRLLKLWEGLGYYNRVRNMQSAAKTIMELYDGELPADHSALLKLKGIGSYTAGAIASLAFGLPVPAVDGNVLRVISRITASREDILRPEVKRHVEEELARILPGIRVNAFNQALMELGAIVCVPNGPAKCEICPLAHLCEAYRLNITEQLPVRSGRKARKIENRTVLIIRDGDMTAVQKRPKKGLLAGLYEFPNLPGHLSSEEVIGYLSEKGYQPIRIQEIPAAKHIFSHVEWHMKGYLVRIGAPVMPEDYLMIDPIQTKETYPIPSAFSAYMKYAAGEETV